MLLAVVVGLSVSALACGGQEFTDGEREDWVEWCWTYTDRPRCDVAGEAIQTLVNERGYDEDCTVTEARAASRGAQSNFAKCGPPDPCTEIRAEWAEAASAVPWWTDEAISLNEASGGSNQLISDLFEAADSQKTAEAKSLAESVHALDISLAETWSEASAYSSSSDPRSKDPAASAGMSEHEWETLSESEQRDWNRDWSARWRLDRGIWLSEMERERAAALAALARLAGDHTAAIRLDADSESWADVAEEWAAEARNYNRAANAMKNGGCWPTPTAG